MKATMFGKNVDLKIDRGVAVIEFGRLFNDTLINNIANFFHIEVDSIKLYLKGKPKEPSKTVKITGGSINTRLLKNIFDNYSNDNAVSVTYSNNNVSIQTKNKVFTFITKNKNLTLYIK